MQGTEELVAADYNVALESNLWVGDEATLFTHRSNGLVDQRRSKESRQSYKETNIPVVATKRR